MQTINDTTYVQAHDAANLITFLATELAMYTARVKYTHETINSMCVKQLCDNIDFLNCVYNDCVNNTQQHEMFSVIAVLFADGYADDILNNNIFDTFKEFCAINNFEYDEYKYF